MLLDNQQPIEKIWRISSLKSKNLNSPPRPSNRGEERMILPNIKKPGKGEGFSLSRIYPPSQKTTAVRP
jgi:hypothetical protein